MERCHEIVERRLDGFFSEDAGEAGLVDSMRYSLLAGGKRIRAIICIKFCEAAGGTPESAVEAACAIEMLHAYTLIHDDLPCMDDDDTRRGKPSNHIKYGEATAILAGDALQASAFRTILNIKQAPGKTIKMARILAEAAGAGGVCGGQYLDLSGEGKPLAKGELLDIHEKKTAELISASARIGVIAGNGSSRQIKAADEYARFVGLAFQARDDVLDYTAAEEVLGKPAGSDKNNNKTTFASLFDIDYCNALIRSETEKAVAALDGRFEKTEFLIWLARELAERKN